jgi:hypothetical protein
MVLQCTVSASEMTMRPKDAVELVLRKSTSPAKELNYRNLPLTLDEIGTKVREHISGVIAAKDIRIICEKLVEGGKAHLISDKPPTYCWGEH